MPSPPRETVFGLIAGSFATPLMYDRITPLLHATNRHTYPIPLPSANPGTLLPAPTMSDNAASIRTHLLSILDSNRDIVLCLQSYAGIPGSHACAGLSRKDRRSDQAAVVGIVYAAAFIPDVGESVRSIMSASMPEFYATGIPGGYFPLIPAEMASGGVFNDMGADEAEREEVLRYGRGMTGHSSDTYSGECGYAAWRDIPGISVVPGRDLIVATEEQERMFERARGEGAEIERVFVEGGGHGITVSQPQVVVDALLKLAGRKE